MARQNCTTLLLQLYSKKYKDLRFLFFMVVEGAKYFFPRNDMPSTVHCKPTVEKPLLSNTFLLYLYLFLQIHPSFLRRGVQVSQQDREASSSVRPLPFRRQILSGTKKIAGKSLPSSSSCTQTLSSLLTILFYLALGM